MAKTIAIAEIVTLEGKTEAERAAFVLAASRLPGVVVTKTTNRDRLVVSAASPEQLAALRASL